MSVVSDLSQYLGRYATCCKSKQLARNMLMSHFTVERGIEKAYPLAYLIHVILDNARYHHAKLLQPWLNLWKSLQG